MYIDIERTVDEEVERETEQAQRARFDITKHPNGFYCVSIPRYEGGEVVRARDYDSLRSASRSALNWITALSQNKPMPEDYHEVVKKLNDALGPGTTAIRAAKQQ